MTFDKSNDKDINNWLPFTKSVIFSGNIDDFDLTPSTQKAQKSQILV